MIWEIKSIKHRSNVRRTCTKQNKCFELTYLHIDIDILSRFHKASIILLKNLPLRKRDQNGRAVLASIRRGVTINILQSVLKGDQLFAIAYVDPEGRVDQQSTWKRSTVSISLSPWIVNRRSWIRGGGAKHGATTCKSYKYSHPHFHTASKPNILMWTQSESKMQ